MSRADIERIIKYKQARLDELERYWLSFTKDMECGEIRELKQSCIDDEIIIECLQNELARLSAEDDLK